VKRRARKRRRTARARAHYVARYANGKRLEFSAVSDAAAVRYATGLGAHRARSKPKSLLRTAAAARRNPSSRDELEQAARAFEDFTGHEATRVEKHKGLSARAGWLLGRCTAISYIATRDGETVEYVHRFKRRSRPQLVSSADGSQLYLLGGAYSVTDRGIVDA
jgi:hypothetical protein